jgi:hypothetical protein
MTADKQSKFYRPMTCRFRSWRGDSNPQPAVYKTAALPVAPRQRVGKGYAIKGT